MAIALRGSTGKLTDSSANSITTASSPAGLAVGDIMVAFVANYAAGAGDMIAVPSGWTLIGREAGPINTNGSWFWKEADAADVAASNFTFTTISAGNNDNTSVTLVAYSGVDTTTPIHKSALNSGTETTVSTVDIPGVTPTVDGCQIVAMGAINNPTNTWSQTQPSGYTEVGHLFGSAVKVDQITHHKNQATAAATGNITFTVSALSSPRWVGGVLALLPSTGGSGIKRKLINGGLINNGLIL